MFNLIYGAFVDTVIMVSVSCSLAFVGGLPIAVLLTVTAPGAIYESVVLNRTVGVIVNIFRAVPFIIILILLIPFTRALVGTTIGIWAAIVPLTVSLIPYFTRIAEVSLREVRKGAIEAAQSIGCNRWHVIRYVIVPEALPGIIGGFTVTVVAAINASAMAGVVGAGGLGDVAIRYGYQRYETTIMLVVVFLLIGLVTLVQLSGDFLSRLIRKER